MNKPLDTRSVVAAYKAVFDNYPKPIPDSFWVDPALKYASYLGMRDQLLEEMQRAIDQGSPMDFGDFARRSFEYSEAVERRRMLNSVIPEADDQVLDDIPGICFTQLMQDWDRDDRSPTPRAVPSQLR